MDLNSDVPSHTGDLQRLGESQKPNSVLGQNSPDSQTSSGIKQFKKPAADHHDDIAASFQYQKPPACRPAISKQHGQQNGFSHAFTTNLPSIYEENRGQPCQAYGDRTGSALPSFLEPERIIKAQEFPEPSKDSRGSDDAVASLERERVDQLIKDYTGTPTSVLTASHPFKETGSYSPLSRTFRQHAESVGSPVRFPKVLLDTEARATFHSPVPTHEWKVSKSTSSPRVSPRTRDKSGATQRRRIETHHSYHNAHKGSDNAPGDLDFDYAQPASRKPPASRRSAKPVMIRPLSKEAQECPVHEMTRPESQGSNISKRRKHLQNERTASIELFEDDKETKRAIGMAVNAHLTREAKNRAVWERKIRKLESLVAAQEEMIHKGRVVIEERDQQIVALQQAKSEVDDRYQQQQEQTAHLSSRLGKLENKLRACRDQLNAATHEQQRIFANCKERCQSTIAQIKADEQTHKESLEHALQNSELVRSEIREKIDTVVNESRKDAESSEKAILALHVQLEERAKELQREKAHVQALNEQLTEVNQSKDDTLQALVTQNKALQESIQKQELQISAFSTELKEARSCAPELDAVSQSLERLRQDTMATIVTETQRVASTQGTDNMVETINAIRQLCEGLNEKVISSQAVADWQERCHVGDMTVEDQVHRIQALQRDVEKMKSQLHEEYSRDEEFQKRISHYQGLEEQLTVARRELAERDATIADSNEKLQQKQEELESQKSRFQEADAQAHKDWGQYQQGHSNRGRLRDEAVQKAAESEMAKNKAELQQAKDRLQLAEVECCRLQKGLKKAQTTINTLKYVDLAKDKEKTPNTLEGVLGVVEQRGEDIKVSERHQDGLISRLEAWSKNQVDIARIQQVLDRLARDQPDAIAIAEQLREFVDIQRDVSGFLNYRHARPLDTKLAAAVGQGQQIEDNETPSSTLPIPLPAGPSASQRRVVVKSPASAPGDVEIVPMSVAEERVVRRQLTLLPLPIIKRVTRSMSKGLEMIEDDVQDSSPDPLTTRTASKKTSKGPLTTHSTYNRIVAGEPSATNGNGQHTNYSGAQAQNAGRKRRRPANGQPGAPSAKKSGETHTKRQKLSRSMSEYWPDNAPANAEPQAESVPKPVRGGPHQRKQPSIVTYGKTDEGAHSKPSNGSSAQQTNDQGLSGFELRQRNFGTKTV